jgi:chromate reductase
VVAWINASGQAAPTGGANAHDSLRIVLGYTGADIVEAACVRIPIARQMVDEDGLIRDDGVRAALADVIATVVEHIRRSRLAEREAGIAEA